MPRISEFFGISIYMYFDDHAPPHFHAIYKEYEALVSINTIQVIKGKLPPRVYGMVVEWAAQHRDELSNNWNRATLCTPLDKIQPLE